jgi:hypothetical protein
MGIPFQILKLQGVGRGKMGIILQEGTWISQVFDSSSGRDLKMVIALGTDLKIPLHDLAVNDLVAGVTFGPEVLRDP